MHKMYISVHENTVLKCIHPKWIKYGVKANYKFCKSFVQVLDGFSVGRPLLDATMLTWPAMLFNLLHWLQYTINITTNVAVVTTSDIGLCMCYLMVCWYKQKTNVEKGGLVKTLNMKTWKEGNSGVFSFRLRSMSNPRWWGKSSPFLRER